MVLTRRMWFALFLLPFCLACQRVPSRIFYLGKEYSRVLQHSHWKGADLSMFIPKGDTQITASTYINIISFRKFSQDRYPAFEALLQVQMKRLGGEPLGGNKQKYCLKSKQRGLEILMLTFLYRNGKTAVVLQQIDILDAKRKGEEGASLCQYTQGTFLELERLAKQSFG